MANNKATLKDVRQVKKRRERNRYQGKTTRNAIRKIVALEDATQASADLPKTIAMIDKLAKNNIIHKNKAANLKSKLVKRVNSLKNTTAAPKAAVKKSTTKKAVKKVAKKK